ncbi:MAG: hypothetical protein JXM73_13935 [Anaerolineae bacterium]|nr:hypothetical protein [Anaerolineae bacterium]
MLRKAFTVVADDYLSYNINNMERGAGENQRPTLTEPSAPHSAQPSQTGEEPQAIFWLVTARKAIALKQTTYLNLTQKQSGHIRISQQPEQPANTYSWQGAKNKQIQRA